MSPLGKLTFALIGFKLFGADGLFAGLFFGHLLVDKTYVIRKIEGYISHWDDVIRIKLPFKYYRYYNRIDGNIWGKLWGIVLGALLFGFWGAVILLLAGHVVFDMPKDIKIRKIKKNIDHFFDNNWAKIFGAILGFVLRSPVLIFVGLILGFVIDFRRLEGAKLIPIAALNDYWQKINPLKLWRNAQVGEHRKYLEVMAALAAFVVEADGKISAKEKKMFCHVFAVKPEQKSWVAEIFENKNKRRGGVEKYAETLEKLTRFNDGLKEVSIENLFRIAVANEAIENEELIMIERIAKIIDLDTQSFDKLKRQFTPKPIDKKLQKYFDVLGVAYDANLAEIKTKWKKLIVVNHPDRLANATDKEIKKATEKMAEINFAYQEIVKAKGKK